MGAHHRAADQAPGTAWISWRAESRIKWRGEAQRDVRLESEMRTKADVRRRFL